MSYRENGVPYKRGVTVQHQPDATLNQANPTSGVQYPVGVLGTAKRNVRIISIAITVTWTVQPDVELYVTVDGNRIRHRIAAPASGVFHSPTFDPELDENSQLLNSGYTQSPFYKAFLYEGKSIKVEAETTGGTVSNLSCRVKWAIRK